MIVPFSTYSQTNYFTFFCTAFAICWPNYLNDPNPLEFVLFFIICSDSNFSIIWKSGDLTMIAILQTSGVGDDLTNINKYM